MTDYEISGAADFRINPGLEMHRFMFLDWAFIALGGQTS